MGIFKLLIQVIIIIILYFQLRVRKSIQVMFFQINHSLIIYYLIKLLELIDFYFPFYFNIKFIYLLEKKLQFSFSLQLYYRDKPLYYPITPKLQKFIILFAWKFLGQLLLINKKYRFH